jgi:hypothetical protein
MENHCGQLVAAWQQSKKLYAKKILAAMQQSKKLYAS